MSTDGSHHPADYAAMCRHFGGPGESILDDDDMAHFGAQAVKTGVEWQDLLSATVEDTQHLADQVNVMVYYVMKFPCGQGCAVVDVMDPDTVVWSLREATKSWRSQSIKWLLDLLESAISVPKGYEREVGCTAFECGANCWSRARASRRQTWQGFYHRQR
jgi:hypothetical protein